MIARTLLLALCVTSTLASPEAALTKELSPSEVGPRDVITKDGLIARDPKWGKEEVLKVERCLRLPADIAREELGDKPISVSFTIGRDAKLSKFKPEPYYPKASVQKTKYVRVQAAMITALKQSRIRAPELPGPPFNAVFYITADKSHLALTAP